MAKKVKVAGSTAALPLYPYPADFCDHFETPRCAYEHIVPVLDAICTFLGRPRHRLQVYDPYFCTGKTREHFASLGFPLVFNQCEDFYKVIEKKETPSYDVLVTNPPYSEDHKEKCLRFCASSGLPWLLLMPCYVASKQYYGASGAAAWYVVPHSTYQYAHPTGKGHEASPFESMWFVGVPPGNSFTQDALLSAVRRSGAYGPERAAHVEVSLEALQESGLVASRRPNPRRRRKERLKRMALA